MKHPQLVKIQFYLNHDIRVMIVPEWGGRGGCDKFSEYKNNLIFFFNKNSNVMSYGFKFMHVS